MGTAVGSEAGGEQPSDSSMAATNADTGSGDAMVSDTGSGSAGGSQAHVVRVTGLFEIPLADVVTVCGESSEMTVSDAVVQQRTTVGSGSTTN